MAFSYWTMRLLEKPLDSPRGTLAPERAQAAHLEGATTTQLAKTGGGAYTPRGYPRQECPR